MLYVKQYRVEDKNNLIIRLASPSSNSGIPKKYPSMRIWKPILPLLGDQKEPCIADRGCRIVSVEIVVLLSNLFINVSG